MAEHKYFDKIEAYLMGQLSSQEARALEQEAANDPQFAEELRLQRLEHDAMERMLQQDLKSRMSTWADSPPANPFLEGKKEAKMVQLQPKKNLRWLRLAAAIAGLLLAVFILREMTKSPDIEEVVEEPPKIEAPNEEPRKDEPTVEEPEDETELVDKPQAPVGQDPTPSPEKPRNQATTLSKDNGYLAYAETAYGKEPPSSFANANRSDESGSEESALFRASVAFDNGNYAKALQLLGSPSPNDQSPVRYLRAHAYFKNKQFAKAEEQFKIEASDEFYPKYQEAKWYLLLSYLAQGEAKKTAFEKQAQLMLADEFSDYKDEVKGLLEKMK